MGSEKFTIQFGTDIVTSVEGCTGAEGADVWVGINAGVGISANVAVGVLAGIELKGLTTAQAEVKIIALIEKNNSFTSLIFLISLKVF